MDDYYLFVMVIVVLVEAGRFRDVRSRCVDSYASARSKAKFRFPALLSDLFLAAPTASSHLGGPQAPAVALLRLQRSLVVGETMVGAERP